MFAGSEVDPKAEPSEGHQGDEPQKKRRTKVIKKIIKKVKSPALVPKPEIPTVKSPALPESTKTVFMPGERHTTRENVVAFFDPATHRREPSHVETAPTLPDLSQEVPASEETPGNRDGVVQQDQVKTGVENSLLGGDQEKTSVDTGLGQEGAKNKGDENGDDQKNTPVETSLKQDDKQNKGDENGKDQETTTVETGLERKDEKNTGDENGKDQETTAVETGLEQKDDQNKGDENEKDQTKVDVGDQKNKGEKDGNQREKQENDDTTKVMGEKPLEDPPAEKQDGSQWTDDDWFWWNYQKQQYYRWWGSWEGDNHDDTNTWSVKRNKEPSTTPSTVASSPNTSELQSCLERASTVDLAASDAAGAGDQGKTDDGKNKTNQGTEDDTEEPKAKQKVDEEKEIARKKAHARYMRYYRSVHESHDLIFCF